MKCFECGGGMKGTRENYSGKDLSLPNLVLVNIAVWRCPKCGEEEIEIPRIAELHRTLANHLVDKPSRLTGAEVRFLRKRMGLSGVDFARRMGVKPETISRWENEHEPIGPTADRLVRLMVVTCEPVKEYPIEHLATIEESNGKAERFEARLEKKHWELATAS